jgi:hypothetical protein
MARRGGVLRTAWKLAKAAKRYRAWRRGEDELFDNGPAYGVCAVCHSTIRSIPDYGWVHTERRDWDHRAEPMRPEEAMAEYERSLSFRRGKAPWAQHRFEDWHEDTWPESRDNARS